MFPVLIYTIVNFESLLSKHCYIYFVSDATKGGPCIFICGTYHNLIMILLLLCMIYIHGRVYLCFSCLNIFLAKQKCLMGEQCYWMVYPVSIYLKKYIYQLSKHSWGILTIPVCLYTSKLHWYVGHMISMLIEWYCRGIVRFTSVNVVFEIYYFAIFIYGVLVLM